VSPLRQLLRRPDTWLIALAAAIALVVADAYQAPANQLSSRVYVAGVHAYQAVGRPFLEGRIQCRYEPTCSVYSIEAVRRFGIRRGLEMTVRRIRACKVDVPLGTVDPVPETLD
jgi:hypothetical protein